MGDKQWRSCSAFGCNKPTQTRFCSEHQKEFDRTSRGSSYQRGYDSEWRKYAKWYLSAEENQECAICGCQAEVVDHIVTPESRQDPLFMSPRNHQPLCRRCNSRKGKTKK